ncbi:cytochrome c oxidase subunit 2A [Paenibacillus piri]|uniref:Cytochrome c oxidase subunit 2A n=1 Tax=Paenibacillus piri TaxID=2547395 RepID=A0A4R5KPA6_9BACL|nr:cytochrome c oxidase subunit 2A [Paenibacillus piri]TDF97539.1 cytochrome c oxidase subunit 2A [Paenibacillus piri]
MDQQHKQEDTALKGTLVSVLLLGGFLILTWVGVFAIFVSRG